MVLWLSVLFRYNVETREESELHLSELVIDNVTLKDNGTYQCRASNGVNPVDETGEPNLLVQGNVFMRLYSLCYR